MVVFCFLVDQIEASAAEQGRRQGSASRCGGGASVADMKTAYKILLRPFYWKSWRAIICTFCGAILRSYR
ncbi:hypothetical protein GBA52_011651 [Prunus armeniaca]|nr:hypothetical protein GBA52_011651 [Prunus armeniaca]